MSVEIFVARHGQNEDNADRILGGHRDRPLTDLGRQQARDLANGIIDAELMFDAVYCSPLIRAHVTADIVADIAKLPEPVVITDLIERDFGNMTGVAIKDVEKMPGLETMKVGEIIYFLDSEGAETFMDVLERAKKVLKDIRDRHDTDKILLVCHGDIGSMIYAAATGKLWMDVLKTLHFGNADLIDISKLHEAHVVKLEQFNH